MVGIFSHVYIYQIIPLHILNILLFFCQLPLNKAEQKYYEMTEEKEIIEGRREEASGDHRGLIKRSSFI